MSIDLSKTKTTQWKLIFSSIANPDISEVEINGPDSVWAMTHGVRKRLTGIKWAGYNDFERSMADVEAHTQHYGQTFANSYCIWEGGLRLYDEMGRLAVKARFHAVKPPVCDFPIVTIAKQSTSLTTLDDICKSGSMNTVMRDFIKTLVTTRQTIVFSGGTGAGKTTFMAACCNQMDPTERVGIYEDAPELDITNHVPNSFNMMSFPEAPGVDKNSRADLDWCIKQAQRQRVDRILVGETRGPEFQSVIVAANSGFEGSMTTLHANDPRMALDKMASFLKRAPGNSGTPMSTINKDIASAINYIIQLGRPNKKYRVLKIEEITKTVGDNDAAKIKTNPIFDYDADTDTWIQKGYPEDNNLRIELQNINGNFESQGMKPTISTENTENNSGEENSWLPKINRPSRFNRHRTI